MRPLILLLFTGCVVKCNPLPSDNYFVIEMPDLDTKMKEMRRPLKVYWNVPTMQCASKRIPFENLDRFGILQNRNDSFRGESIAILYDPGMFPALLKEDGTGKFRFRNGGVPQEGNLEKHLDAFQKSLEESIPDKDFSGVGVIDFESWRPVFRQNFGTLSPYKDVSYEIEKKRHMWWPKTWIQAEAKKRFETAGRLFMESTLRTARSMRPRALWGYYGFPYCFNMQNNHMGERCADNVPQENDNISWLWEESTALYPSIYSSKSLTTSQLAAMVRGRMREASRVARGVRGMLDEAGADGEDAEEDTKEMRGAGKELLPYYWFRYRDGGYMSKDDLQAVLRALYNSDATGFIIWGSSNDVNTPELCHDLLKYVNDVLGPTIAKYAIPRNEQSGVLHDYESYTTTEIANSDISNMSPYELDLENLNNTDTDENDSSKVRNVHIQDPDFDWEPPENYQEDIIKFVHEHLKNSELVNENSSKDKNDILLDLILHAFQDKEVVLRSENNSQIDRLDNTTYTEHMVTNINETDYDNITVTEKVDVTSTEDNENVQVRQIRRLTTDDMYWSTGSSEPFTSSTTENDLSTRIDDEVESHFQGTLYTDSGASYLPDKITSTETGYEYSNETITSTTPSSTSTVVSTTEINVSTTNDYEKTDSNLDIMSTTILHENNTYSTTEQSKETTELQEVTNDVIDSESTIEDLVNMTPSSLVSTDSNQVFITIV